MSEHAHSTDRQGGSLADRCPLPPDEALATLGELLSQVASLHEMGRLHGNIAAESVALDGERQVRLLGEPAVCHLAGSEAAPTPPELAHWQLASLPTDLHAAREALITAGIQLDPRRIDVFQLGALFCRMLTGLPVSLYLRSAKARSRVPASLANVIDRTLGYDSASRLNTCSELAAALSQAANAAPAAGSALQMHGNAASPLRKPVDLHAVTLPPPVPPQRSPAVRGQLGKYQIVERIGAGGMGDVFQAYDQALDRTVAIKVLPAELARQEDFVRRFRAEATAVAKLVHPNIVQIYTLGEEDGQIFFVMQYVRGESLAQRLARRKRLPIDETLETVREVLAGLGAAHDRGLIHRDIKPGNILLDHDHRRALVADFGLVKSILPGSTPTVTGVILGTVDYISPEQARGLAVDARSDLYSLGVMMYQMLAGRLPFLADTPTGMIFQHAYEPPPSLAEVAPDVPPRLAAMVARLLAKNPAQRHQSADELLADIAAFRAGKVLVPERGPASKSAGQTGFGGKSAVIVAPRLDRPLQLPAVAARASVAPGWFAHLWQQLRASVSAAAGRSPDTQQQVDVAVAEYERRRDELARLVQDAEGVAAEFAAQVGSHREAAANAWKRIVAAGDSPIADQARQEQTECERVAAEFAEQLAEQRRELDEMRSRLATTDTILEQLRGQRDALRSRLASVEARLSTHGGQPRHTSRPWWIAAAAVGLLAIGIYYWSTHRDPAGNAKSTSLPRFVAPRVQPTGDRPAPLDAPYSAAEGRAAQDAWARYLGLPSPIITNSIGMTLVVVPPGDFLMGTPLTERYRGPEEGPQHQVRITRAMLVGAYEVTQAEFVELMGFNPSFYAPSGLGRRLVAGLDTSRFPVDSVTWFDACEFCNALSREEGLKEFYAIDATARRGKHIVGANVRIRGGQGNRLPTEAEFENFCRAGTTTPFWFGSVHDGTQGNAYGLEPYGTQRPGPFLNRTTTVGSYPPNPLGLYDIDANLGEWCWDYFDPREYSRRRSQVTIDPLGPDSGTLRVTRSNSSQYAPGYGRSGRHHGDRPDFISGWFGLRVVRTVEE